MSIPGANAEEWAAPGPSQGFLGYLRREGEVRQFARGDVLLRRGERGEAVWVLLAGAVEVQLRVAGGRPLTLRQLEPGAVFGEIGVLTQSPVSADVVAATPVTVLRYPGELLGTAIAECAPLRDYVLATLAANLRDSSKDVWNFFQKAEALRGLADFGVIPGPLVAESGRMRRVASALAACASSEEPVLLEGESGSGKLFLAGKIHETSPGPSAPFIVVDCAAVSGDEQAAFLFGGGCDPAQQAAGTDAELHCYGALHLANRGTLVLQHVERLEGTCQALLVAYLKQQREEGAVYPQARIIATTRQDLSRVTAAGRFSAALADRFLGEQRIHVPALAERKRDILPLARQFLAEKRGQDGPALSTSAEHVLVSRRYRHDNARELREAVELAGLIAGDGVILAEHIFTGPKERSTRHEVEIGALPWVEWLLGDSAIRVARGSVFWVFAATALLCLSGWKTGAAAVNAAVWGLWWPALIVTFLFLGRLWCTVCPLSTAARWARRFLAFGRAPPSWLKKYSGWLIPVCFLAIVWAEHAFGMLANPAATGLLLLTLGGGAVLFAVLFQREVWCRYVCALGNLGAIYSLSAPLSVRANPDVCATCCTTHECHKGSNSQEGCPTFHHPLYARDSHRCKLCFNCLKSCPHGSAKLFLRPPLARVWREGEMGGGLGAFALMVVFLAPLMLASKNSVWTGNLGAYTAGCLLALGLGRTVHRYLPRFLFTDPGVPPGTASKVAFALLVLGWGPVAAFHLSSLPVLDALSLRAADASAVAAFLKGGQLSVAVVVQLGALALASVLAGISLLGVRNSYMREGVELDPRGWKALLAFCLVYVALNAGVVWWLAPVA